MDLIHSSSVRSSNINGYNILLNFHRKGEKKQIFLHRGMKSVSPLKLSLFPQSSLPWRVLCIGVRVNLSTVCFWVPGWTLGSGNVTCYWVCTSLGVVCGAVTALLLLELLFCWYREESLTASWRGSSQAWCCFLIVSSSSPWSFSVSVDVVASTRL